MERLLEITDNLLKKRNINKKRFAYFNVFVLLINVYVIYFFFSNYRNADFVLFVDVLLLVLLDHRFFNNNKTLHWFDCAIQQGYNFDIIDMYDFQAINYWMKQNKNQFRKTDRMSRIFLKRGRYYVWGCIESPSTEQLVIVDMSKKNTLISLNIKKEDLDQYDESSFMKKTIERVPKRKEHNERFVGKYFFSHLVFYVEE
ncbi:hypothetical protein [Fructobacillus fructosus]|uniref:hypothetical protein n=1 Tax=Fructobacillus fructosus TaxID=1631 RepID=UPI002DADBCB7|nr:unnamed protein product [Fructobacillus fructosus]CAK1246273.1 unnamed protein product [Fructobacillus fructosus]CAK1247519.1 unnamed protein product [Fructobacillus fructosus]